MENQSMMNVMAACNEASIYVMGISFVVGSLTTLLVLVLLDMYRARSANAKVED